MNPAPPVTNTFMSVPVVRLPLKSGLVPVFYLVGCLGQARQGLHGFPFGPARESQALLSTEALAASRMQSLFPSPLSAGHQLYQSLPARLPLYQPQTEVSLTPQSLPCPLRRRLHGVIPGSMK